MAIITDLQEGMSLIFDQEYPGFTKHPQTDQEAATRWSQVFKEYGSKINPPSGTLELATTQMENILLTNKTPVKLETAIQTFATVLATGMTPSGFTGTPPPGPLTFASVYALGFAGQPSSVIVSQLSTITDNWFRTGTATNISTGVTIPWS